MSRTPLQLAAVLARKPIVEIAGLEPQVESRRYYGSLHRFDRLVGLELGIVLDNEEIWRIASQVPEERKILFDYWVEDVLIVVQRVPGKKRANQKTAIVTLRAAPNAPKYFALGGQPGSRSKALATAPSTDGLDSIDHLARSASIAPGEPISPNAQAACSRTSGSSSDSAAESAGTSSAEPTLPSTTAAFRCSPRSFARFIGLPLNAALNSACVIASRSRASVRASLPARNSRGANSSTVFSLAYRTFHGHTSWEMCRHNHFEIPLGTGSRPLAKTMRT
jgi:hypothetical protein